MDIVEWLRDYYHMDSRRYSNVQIADEIERWQEKHHDVRILNEQYFNENEILLDEIERLREALKETLAVARRNEIGDYIQRAEALLQQKDSE